MNNEEKILEILTTLTKKVDKIETEHGELLRTLDARSLKSAVLLETEIPHKLGLLFEGHKTILETLSPKSRVDELEEEVTILRSAFQALANRLTALEKAQ